MPTPFMHIDYAERMLRSPQLGPQAAPLLRQNWSDFYLGSIAADYQALCDVPRETTHFYPVPLPPEHDAIGLLFAKNPTLQMDDALSPAIAAFMAGYIAHLNFDLVWYREIMLPFFVLSDQWADMPRRERFTVHNILLTFLDKRSLEGVPDSAEITLRSATPPADIPFLNPAQVAHFQTMLVDQLAPGSSIKTIEIYAERMGITSAEFGQHLDDAEWMQTNLFDRVSLEKVLAILEKTVHNSAELITAYLTQQLKA